MRKRNLVFFDRDKEHIAEAIRILRTNLYFTESKDRKVVLITSSIPKEGKSTIAANYALSVAISGEKVILVDCDIRRPRVVDSFGIKANYGLEEVLRGKKNLEDVILHNVERNLDLLPATSYGENVTELFLGKKIVEILDKLKDEYNLIVLDTPPLTVATDAALLSTYADGVVYVVGYDMVFKKELLSGKKLLEKAGANIYGVVVNKVDINGYAMGNYGHYSSNYKYYDEYKKR
ncbi:CpsD/CapB family tyrosine-protein kinase [uncultured Ilyobacter sp.]|uniref:CpsD/CapB family tyrosine-protein kinase n=1 Tax=uncultured Ilyobacter sp. TaxID=544433 RepID=UPI0029C77F2D|nr:CpsD/CapB family tyrosine-protein kinase [uncultured Ilyobacter sp.]